MKQNFLNIPLILFIIKYCNGLERELTVNIDPGKEDCFYQAAKEGDVIDVEYQVIDGGHGDLDITFRLSDPNRRVWITDYKKSENSHRIDAKVTGDYRFCFDNTFSRLNTKTIFFELIIENDNEDSEFNEKQEYPGLKPEDVYDIKVEDIHELLNNVKNHLTRIRLIQDSLKGIEARDRNLAEENYWKVNTLSMVQITIMLIVGFVQVIMVRSLFDDTSRVHKIWESVHLK